VNFRQTNRNYRGLESVVTSRASDPILAVRWLDNLYSEENYILMNFGVENQSWYFGESGERYFTELITHNPHMNVAEAMSAFLVHSGPMRRIWWREEAMYTPDELGAEAIWWTAADDYVIPATITFTPEEGTRNASLMTDIETYILEMSLNFITGRESLDNFGAFQEQLRAMNIEEAIAIRQAALDRFYARE
jgi:putative aldouronate transport system substrate-binding protein